MWKRELDSFTPAFFCGIPQRRREQRGGSLCWVFIKQSQLCLITSHSFSLQLLPKQAGIGPLYRSVPTGVSGGLPQQLLFAFWCPEQTRGSSALLQAPSAGAESVELSQNLPLKSASSPQRKQQRKLRLRELCFSSAVNLGGAVLQHRNEPVHTRVHADKTRCKMLSTTCLKEAI